MEKINNIERALQEAEYKKKSAEEAQKQAAQDIKMADEDLKKLKKAKQLVDEANAKLDEADKICGVSVQTKEDKKSGMKSGFLKGVALGTACTLIGGAITYLLVKESKTGTIKSTSKAETIAVDDQVLTDEEFDKIVAEVVKDMKERGVTLSESDIQDFVMYLNSSELATDNQKLMASIVSEQDSDEIEQDANKFLGSSVMTNYNLWFEDKSTEDFINASDYVFDEEQKAKLVEIERRVDEIALVYGYGDYERVDELTRQLLLDLSDPNSGISYLDAGTGYGAQIALEPVRGLFGMNFSGYEATSILSESTNDLIKYHVPYAEDDMPDNTEDDKYTANNMHTGYIRDIKALISECLGNEPTLSSYTSDTSYVRKRSI